MKKKLLCAVMCCVLICGTFAPKRAYAVAGVDDAAVVIVCALLAAAGLTFASNDGVQDAVEDFLDASAGKYDSTIERLSSGYSVYGSVGAFKIPTMAMGGVRLLLEGLFDYFKTDEYRQGVVSVSSGSDVSDFPYLMDVSNPNFISFCDFSLASFSAPVYVLAHTLDPVTTDFSKRRVSYHVVSSKPFSGSYFRTNTSSPCTYDFSSLSDSFVFNNTKYPFYYSKLLLKTEYSFSSFLGISVDDMLFCDSNATLYKEVFHPALLAVLNGFSSVEKSIPYGLTFPEGLTSPDVIDNFEQRVEAAAGDLAIVVPVDGVIDNTLPYADAQEQYLVNVNELGEVTDTVTETNSWLSKILTAVKALPATVIGTGSLDFSGFQNIGLSSVFPFCIPFDLKNALVGFNVTPVDPIWEISFEGTFMSAAGTYVLDMTKFEKLFAVVRFFIYGGFVVSLILLTRKIIKG